MTDKELDDLLEKAAEKGAVKVLAMVGLSDETAGEDIRNLRSLLSAYKSAKHTVWQTFWRIVTTIFISGLMAGTFMHFKG